jgi:MoaA/NifB/PqqE/SkfB family radical SAM enzyme
MGKIYSNLKFINFPDRIEALRHNQLAAPVHIRIKPMNHCNHNCWYCAYRFDNLQLGSDIDLKDQLPEDKMFEIVDDVIDMGVQAITFSGGGEPLLYKPLPEVMKRLHEGGIKVASLTNGSNLKGKVADAFAEYATWVRVSVDGWDDQSYTEARQVKLGAFSQLIDNMTEFLKRESKCVLGISFIIDEKNHDHIFEFCELMKKVGVNHVKLTGVVVENDGADNNKYHDHISEEVTRQIKAAQELQTESFSVLDHYHSLPDLFAKEYNFCPSLQMLTIIGADSNVYSCHDKAYTVSGKLGSIKDQSFKDFWFSEENREAIYGLDPTKSCLHHCTGHHKNLALLDILKADQEHVAFI